MLYDILVSAESYVPDPYEDDAINGVRILPHLSHYMLAYLKMFFQGLIQSHQNVTLLSILIDIQYQIYHFKTDEQRTRLDASVKKSFLFNNLDEVAYNNNFAHESD